ncbi:MAG: hypothetical protein JWQ18_558 [Conexibacter sp.]|nr:hypothetical protein [Conexibacter sp.]
MTRRAIVLALITAFALLVPAVALAGIKRGTYIEPTSQTYIVTNAAATSIKTFQFPCVVGGEQRGGNTINKVLKISKTGAFSFKGKSTLRSEFPKVISVKISGRYVNGKIKGKVQYLTTGTGCEDRSYSAKYYGVNPQG